MPTLESDKFITETELEKLLGMPHTAMTRRRFHGRDCPKYLKLGRSIRYRMRDVEQWLADRTIAPRAIVTE